MSTTSTTSSSKPETPIEKSPAKPPPEDDGLRTAREPVPKGKWRRRAEKVMQWTWDCLVYAKQCLAETFEFLTDTYNREVLVYNLVLLVFAFVALGLSGYVLLTEIIRAYDDSELTKPALDIEPLQEVMDFWDEMIAPK
uniref:Transmembrane protein n=1 Tax=Caenorhabditis tropicalis TaxID=1561998 RepID=A0A1I7UGU3_9PELO